MGLRQASPSALPWNKWMRTRWITGNLGFHLGSSHLPIVRLAILPTQRCFRGQGHFSVVHRVFLKPHDNTLAESTTLDTTGKKLSITGLTRTWEREKKKKKANWMASLPFLPSLASAPKWFPLPVDGNPAPYCGLTPARCSKIVSRHSCLPFILLLK